jgi:membrane-associated phospholipid phosphatase
MDRRPLVALTAALACALALAVVGFLALGVAGVQARDADVLDAFVGLSRPSVNALVDRVAHLADEAPYALAGLTLAAVAIARRRPQRAVAVVALLVVTGLTTLLLKQLCSEPRVLDVMGEGGPDRLAWPSGHATAAMTLALCAVLVAPPRLRALAVVLGGAFALAVGYAVMVLRWHYPSDVLAGFLVAGTWTSLARALLAVRERDEPAPAPGPGLGAAFGFVAAVAAAVGIVVVAVHAGAARYALERPSLVAVALGLAAMAAALPAALSRS